MQKDRETEVEIETETGGKVRDGGVVDVRQRTGGTSFWFRDVPETDNYHYTEILHEYIDQDSCNKTNLMVKP